MARKSLADIWLEENDPENKKPPQRPVGKFGTRRKAPFFLCDLDREAHDRRVLAEIAGRRIGKARRPAPGEPFVSVKHFLDEAKTFTGDMCLLVPFAIVGAPATVYVAGKQESAARHICRSKNGSPPPGGAHLARHLCGNGHLSCVNPNHLVWGTAEDNVADKVLHRTTPRYHPEIDEATMARIIADRRHPNVMAVDYQIHTIVLLAIKAAQNAAN